jgi:hypothetical protein
MNNKEKRLETIEQILNDILASRPPMDDEEFCKQLHEDLTGLCDRSGPEECEKLLLTSKFLPIEKAAELVELLVREFCDKEIKKLMDCLPLKNPPETRRTCTRGDRTYFIDKTGLLKLREGFLSHLDEHFNPWSSGNEGEKSTLGEIIEALPESQKERLREIAFRTRLIHDSKSLHCEDKLTADDRAFLKTIFPKYYEWGSLLGRKEN